MTINEGNDSQFNPLENSIGDGRRTSGILKNNQSNVSGVGSQREVIPNQLSESHITHKSQPIINMSRDIEALNAIEDSRMKLDKSRKPRSSLVVTITNVEFVKDFHYFIAVQLDREGERRRTEVSSAIATPIFKTNTFTIPLQGFKLQYHEFL